MTTWKEIIDEKPPMSKWVILNTEDGKKAVGKLVTVESAIHNCYDLYWVLTFGKIKPFCYFFEWTELP
jgi:hypothetical protein